ncbi:MAG TPA: hypothetical protein VFD59_12715, partial [Nocardioidaceae bacterium]|nr:hypothetical protein [Nocardioidaceae bacterium]
MLSRSVSTARKVTTRFVVLAVATTLGAPLLGTPGELDTTLSTVPVAAQGADVDTALVSLHVPQTPRSAASEAGAARLAGSPPSGTAVAELPRTRTAE